MEIRDVILARKRNEQQFARETVVYVGQIVARDGKTAVPGVHDHVWVLPYGEGEPEAVYNRRVKTTRPGLWVQVGFAPKSNVLEILSTFVDVSAGYEPTAGLDMPNHGPTHKRRGDDPVDVDRRMITDQLYLSPGSGLAVNVSPCEYDDDSGARAYFPGQLNFDISASSPAAGLARWVLVYLDTADNTIKAVAGATVPDFDWMIPVKPNTPIGGITAGYVRLDEPQTSVTESDIDDGRRPRPVTLAADADTLLGLAGQQLSLDSQAANRVLAGPTSGAAADPTFRALVAADIPNPLRVKNTSGATANAGDSGYIDAAGEYKTTTTEAAGVSWCLVVTGGANNADIYVARRGRGTFNYAGSDPVAGDYLVTSTTAGKAKAQATMRPEIFAVCVAAGSGGTVEGVLLCGRSTSPVSSGSDVIRIDNHSGTDFVATIAAKSGADVEYTITAGNEDSIVPAAATQLGKIVLYNTTRGTSALIDSVNNTNTGTPADGTITLTATTPADWQIGDVITCRSQVNTNFNGTIRYFDIDLSSSDNTAIPANAVMFHGEMLFTDLGTAGDVTLLRHPYETGAASKRAGLFNSAPKMRRLIDVPLIDRKFCFSCAATGSGTAVCYIRVSQIVTAEP